MKYKLTRWLVALMPVLAGLQLMAQDTVPIKTLPPITVTATTKKLPENVWKNFRNYFENASNPRFYELNKNYLAEFMMDNKDNHALFTKKGRLIYHISYGYENSLPEDLKSQIKYAYNDYTITRAIKVTEANRTIWVVNLEDAKNLIMVRLENGEMEEVKKYEKSS